MGMISTTLKLSDKFSAPLQKINRSLVTSTRLMYHFESQVRAMNDLTSRMVTVVKTNPMQKSYSEASDSMRNLNQETKRHADSQNLLWTKAKQLASAYAGIEGLGALFRTSDELTNIKARLDLINDGLQSSVALENMIFDAAERSRGAYTTTAQTVARIGMNAKNAFGSTKEIVGFAELLNKQFIIAGANHEDIRSATIQLTQAMGSGILRGEELNSVFESAPNIIESIANYMNAPIGQIREMAANGEITAEIIKNAMFTAADDIDKKFSAMPYTFSQVWQQFKNKALDAWMPLYERMRQFANGATFQAIFTKLVGVIELLANAGIKAVDAISSVMEFLKDHIDTVTPLVMSLTAAYITQGVAAMFAKDGMITLMIAQGGQALASAKAAVASFAATSATVAQTFATQGLTAALLACPLTWVVGVVALLVTGLYFAVNAFNDLSGSSVSATGIIVGCFYWVLAVANNVVSIVWDIIASVIEFIINGFAQSAYNVRMVIAGIGNAFLDFGLLVYDVFGDVINFVANGFRDLINKVIGAFNKLPFSKKFDLIADGDFAVKEMKKLTRAKEALAAWNGDAPEDHISLPRMERKDPSAAYSEGYKDGEKFIKKLKGTWSLANELGYTDEQAKSFMEKWGITDPEEFAKFLTGDDADYQQENGIKPKSSDPYRGAIDKIQKDVSKIASDDFDERITYLKSLGMPIATNRDSKPQVNNFQIEIHTNGEVRDAEDLYRKFVDKVQSEFNRKVLALHVP